MTDVKNFQIGRWPSPSNANLRRLGRLLDALIFDESTETRWQYALALLHRAEKRCDGLATDSDRQNKIQTLRVA